MQTTSHSRSAHKTCLQPEGLFPAPKSCQVLRCRTVLQLTPRGTSEVTQAVRSGNPA